MFSFPFDFQALQILYTFSILHVKHYRQLKDVTFVLKKNPVFAKLGLIGISKYSGTSIFEHLCSSVGIIFEEM